MAVTILVSNILRNAAESMGVPAFSTNTNVTESQAIYWLTESLESLQALNAQKLGADHHHISSISLNTQPNVNFLTLPSDAIELFDVIWMKAPDVAYRVVRADAAHVLPLTTRPEAWDRPPVYRLEGVSLVFFPPPTTPCTLSLWYGQASQVQTPASTMQGRLDWQRWLELDLAITCLTKKRRLQDVVDFTAKRDALSLQMFAPGRKRDRAGPSRIMDVEMLRMRPPWYREY